MTLDFLLVNAFALALASFAWMLWRRWQLAEQRALSNARLALLGEGVTDIAHDLQNMCTAINLNLMVDPDAQPDELHEVFADVRGSMESVASLVWAIRGAAKPRHVNGGSAGGIAHLLAAVLRRQHVRIEVEMIADFRFDGEYSDAFRVVENLLVNAVREARLIDSGRVVVTVDSSRITVSNPVRDPSRLDAAIYEPGVSDCGSSGRGLVIVRESAERLGWTVRHEVSGPQVSFLVERHEQDCPVSVESLAAPRHYRNVG